MKTVNRSRDAAVFSFTTTRVEPLSAKVFEACEVLNHNGFWSNPTKRNVSSPKRLRCKTRKRSALHQQMRKRRSRFVALILYRRFTCRNEMPYFWRQR